MKRIFIYILPIVLMTACVENLDDWNVDQKKASAVPARTLFTNSLKGIIDIVTTPNVNSNNFRMFVQYWATTTYLDEPRYNMTARLYSQNQWYAAYRDALNDLERAKKLVTEDELLDSAIKSNQLALVEIMEVYCWNFLVNTFGDVPYTEAMDPNNPLPVYDDAATIYADLLVRLDAAIASLNADADTFSGGADVIYGGSAAKWKLFGNSLKLKMGMLLADVDAGKAKTLVEQAVAGGVLAENEDRAAFPYISASPNNNPISTNLNKQFTSREDFVVAETIVDEMNAKNDPRRQFYFTMVDDVYKGGDYGFANSYAKFSHVSAKIIATTFEGLYMDAAEVKFLLAEAVERGFITGSAEMYYNDGITKSILYWGGTDADVSTYLAQSSVAYGSADGDWKKKIGTQKWIALNNRGWDSWVEWRRLDQPVLEAPSGNGVVGTLKIPTRMIYPVVEQTVNGDQWSSAAGRYNSDSPDAKLFWDVH